VELAHLLGARVIAAVGSAAKDSVVREYGAAEVIDYSREDVRDRVKALTGGEGLSKSRKCVGSRRSLTASWPRRRYLPPLSSTSVRILAAALIPCQRWRGQRESQRTGWLRY